MYRQLAAAVWFACTLADLGAQRRSTMKLELILPRNLYLTGEDISLDIRLTNTGTAAVDAPLLAEPGNSQPVYRLEGPSYPHGVSFNFRDSRQGSDSVPASPPATHHLVPGATMETGFSLTSLQPVAEPGEYTVRARIDARSWSAESAPLKFRVEKARFLESSLGVDAYSRSARTLRAVWIAESAGGRLLGESFFYEKRPDLGEIQVTATRIIRKIGPQAANPFCPWITFNRMEAPKFWHGWQEGAKLIAFSDDEHEPRTFDMGSSKAQIVQPTFMSRAGDLDVLVLGENRKTLRLVRFPPPPEAKPAVLWTIDLPEEAAAIRLGIGPGNGNSPNASRIAAAVSQSGLKVALHLIRLGEKSAQIDPPALFDSAFLLPDSEPSVSIAPDGSIHAAVLFAKHPALRTLAVGDLTIKDGKTETSTTNAGRTEAPVLQAWTAHRVTSEGPPTRVWLIRTEKGAAGGGEDPIPVAATAPVVALLRMSVATYVLALDPHRGPHLLPADF